MRPVLYRLSRRFHRDSRATISLHRYIGCLSSRIFVCTDEEHPAIRVAFKGSVAVEDFETFAQVVASIHCALCETGGNDAVMVNSWQMKCTYIVLPDIKQCRFPGGQPNTRQVWV